MRPVNAAHAEQIATIRPPQEGRFLATETPKKVDRVLVHLACVLAEDRVTLRWWGHPSADDVTCELVMWSGKPAGDDGEMPLHIYRFSVLPEHYESPADILRRVNLAVTDCRCTFQKLWEGRAAVLGPSPMVNVPLDSAARYLLGLYDYVEGREDYEEPHWVQTDGGLNEALTTLYTEVYGHPPEVR